MSDKIEFETFREIGNWERSCLETKEPSCFNGYVNVEKFKITVEKISEPKEVMCERLQKLWDECDNHHHWTPLENKAKEYGYEFKNSAGEKRKRGSK